MGLTVLKMTVDGEGLGEDVGCTWPFHSRGEILGAK
jgi:hypothetical protein